ncbi:hypothetical protein HYN59_10215 [Flavobacterium album]|uniref:Uncharacterized protein n=1 Tax=Flavobacterium album TaxID=2175091 RepID=A0A2S1QYG6_9FLAO|nr:hypothetical protein [Flavobacterium album]AWH85467.1 hypothetical protein HYN59_10215 [Flavobacterium album]
MIRKITLLFAFLFSITALAQSECAKFKNGTFKVTDPASKKVCIIKRDGNTQTERMEESDETYDFDIVWIDDCTYTVSPTASTAARNKDVLKAGTITVKMTKVKESSYVQKVTVANNPKFRRVDEVFLMESK